MKTLQIDEQTEKDLKAIRNFVATKAKTRTEHMYCSVLTMLVNKLSGETVKLRESCDCKMSGSCRYERVMHSKQEECRHKLAT